jgi:hypothetical protein
MTVLMKNGNHLNCCRRNREITGIGKPMEQAAPHSALNFWKLERVQTSTREDVIKLIEKTTAQTGILPFIPIRSITDFKLCLLPQEHNSHLSFGVATV